MIDSATISKVMEAADIVDVVKDFVTLRKAGVNYKGLCPFHNEKTPSFVVSPSKQLCKCFSCGKGGNAVHFIMEHEQMTYPEAIKWLGNKYGIEVRDKELTDEEKVAASARESLFVVNEWARDYFINLLHNHVDGVAIGMAYFRSRGFRDDIIQKFQLGFALPSRDALAREAQQKGFNPELLLKTGLCFRTDDGRLLDRYHGRVIFPVHTISGKVVAFGGRILSSDKKLAKYVNSPESIIYSKSKELYGLYQAKHAIVKHNRCFLVEGYTDVISMHQSGIENVVASSGTSLTEGQIRLIHRFTNNITVLYDGDSAGIKASLRGIDMLLAEGMNIKVLLLPDGDDPDSFSRKHNAAEFQKYLEQHQVDFIRFKTGLLLEDSGNDPIKRAGLIQDVVNSISVIPDRIIRQMYAKECASMLGISEQLVVSEIAKIKKEKATSERTTDSTKNTEGTGENEESAGTTPAPSDDIGSLPANTRKEEELLVRIIVRFGEQILFKGEDGSDIRVATFIASDLEADGLEMHSPLFQKMLNEAALYCQQEDFHAQNYFLAHPDAEISKTAARLCEDRFQLSQRQQIGFIEDKDRLQELVPRLLHDFKNTKIKEEMKKLLTQLRSPETMYNSEKCLDIMSRYKELCEIEKQFAQILGDRVIMP